MAWIALIAAGILETAWASGLKGMSDKFSVGLLMATLALIGASLGALYWSMRTLPLGIAYPIWTGIGSIGSVVVSVILYKQQIGISGIAGVSCRLIGMFLIGLETR